jgi:hypothetical protein
VDVYLWLTRCCFCVQVGDGSTIQRNTSMGVSGLGSGVSMVALGWVRCVVISWSRLMWYSGAYAID